MFDAEFDLEPYRGITSWDAEDYQFGSPSQMKLTGDDDYKPRSSYRSKMPIVKDPHYYHVHLFGDNENFSIVRETEKAVLYQVDDGKFWVPKKLLKTQSYNDPDHPTILVHKIFKRKYVEDHQRNHQFNKRG